MESSSPKKSGRVRLIKYIIPAALLLVGIIVWKPVKERIACRTNQPKYLLDAISQDEYWKVKLYVDSGCEVNKLHFYPNSKPFYVNVSGDIYDVTEQDRFALGEASINSRPEVVKYLLGKGARPDYATRSGSTALHLACRVCRNITTIKLLLEGNANINAVGSGGMTPLDVVDVHHSEIIDYMLNNGALLGGKKMSVQEARDFESSSFGNQSSADQVLFVNRSHTLNRQDSLNELLCRAVKADAVETVEMLLKRGADPNIKDRSSGKVPLVLIAMPHSEYPGSYLYSDELRHAEHGAEMASLLLRNGAKEPLAKTKDGRTLLHLACKMHDAKLAKVLLRAGADPNAKDKQGKTPNGYLTPVEEEVR